MKLNCVEIQGRKFTFFPLPPLEAMSLDKQISGQLLKGLSGANLDPEKLKKENSSLLDTLLSFDVGGIVNSFGAVISEWEDAKFFDFSLRLLQRTQVVVPNKAPFEILGKEEFNSAFTGLSPFDIYKILLEAMKFNNFSLFKLGEMVGIGGLIQQITSTKEEEQNEIEITPK